MKFWVSILFENFTWDRMLMFTKRWKMGCFIDNTYEDTKINLGTITLVANNSLLSLWSSRSGFLALGYHDVYYKADKTSDSSVLVIAHEITFYTEQMLSQSLYFGGAWFSWGSRFIVQFLTLHSWPDGTRTSLLCWGDVEEVEPFGSFVFQKNFYFHYYKLQ